MVGSTPPASAALDPTALLCAWEWNAACTPVHRALSLLGLTSPSIPEEELWKVSIGQRDASLLDLYDRLFGSRIECTTSCPHCEAKMEAVFDSSDIRAKFADEGVEKTTLHEGFVIRWRLPTSSDLAEIEHLKDFDEAWHTLMRRSIVEIRYNDQPAEYSNLSPELLGKIEEAAGSADAQADVVITLPCPDCGLVTNIPFDIGRQVWAHLDHWAKATLAAVDAIAARYGWPEAQILQLSPNRRQRYLDLIAGVAA